MSKLKFIVTYTAIGFLIPDFAVFGTETSTPEVRQRSTNTQQGQNEQPSNTTPAKSPLKDARIDNAESNYQINPDYSYTLIADRRVTLLTQRSTQEWQRDSISFYPDTQSVQLLEAYVVQPNGKKIPVSKDNVFTRSSAEGEDAPGFSSSMTTTVVFPQLSVGSQTYVKWKLTQKKPSVVGFSGIYSPSFRQPTVKETIKITLPAKLRLQWKKRGDYAVTDQVQGNKRVITAVIKNQPARQPENYMVSGLDISPIFLFSNLKNWEEIGNIYWKQSKQKILVTQEIKALANKITGKKTGIEAARAIYNWIAQNINYVAVYLNESAGYVPHSSTDILRNGYGDCKDHVVLMQALLQAKGINSVPVLVDWGNIHETMPIPTPYQFNHAMIYLPDYKIFANPTNEHAAFGELDDSLLGKFVVLAGDKSSTAYTPNSDPSQNRYSMKSSMAIANDGTVTGNSQLSFFGNLNSSARNFFSSDTAEEIANSVLSVTPEGGTGSLQTSNLENLNEPVTVKASWRSPYAINIGQQIYFTVPAGFDTNSPHHLRDFITPGQRLYPLAVGAETFNWEYTIKLPLGYKIARLPDNINFSNGAGKYTSTYEARDSSILVKRSLVINKSIYSAQEYPAFEELMYKPINDSRNVIVLNKSS